MEDIKLAKEISVLYTGYHINPHLNHPVEKDEICQSRLDPVLGVTGDFNLFDFALVNIHYPSMPRILFVPSIQFIHPGSNVAVIGFPWTELLNRKVMKDLRLPGNYKSSLPPFEYLRDIFFGFGKKCISIGKTSSAFGVENGEWKALENFEADINQYSIISNETVFFGNSGGPVICLDNCKIVKAYDKCKREWKLVKFNDMHSGGEFVNCIDCLHKLPNQREDEYSFNLQICNSCKNHPNRKKTPLRYNYSISVHHSDFARCYINSILPRLRELFPDLLNCIQDYVNLHSQHSYTSST